ncbi:hypothetical protein QFC22_005219 [Naganishia vaughanmartiniae]|uniref:Uncharacterized protein n=1 Tax=Naganishia vaughanmartiniae TaxID=1424756 RepID=A0ACC2WVL0_9TREE|nr:hypothetical protein QFC22_005219 [Naganishia vaughanmartiniae]
MANVETSPPQRTTKTRRREAWQIDILEAFYRHVGTLAALLSLWLTSAAPLQKHMPDKQEKEMLANRISDTLKYVNIWFQVRFLARQSLLRMLTSQSQNRRQAAQKKGELRPRETYEHWRHRRHADYDLYSGPTPPEYSTSAASTSYFAQSYPTHETILATPREMEEHRMPSVSSSMMASPPGGQPAHSPFAFALPLPLKGHSGANPLSIPESRSRPVYASATSYERPTCTPPHSAEGLPASTHAYNYSQSYPDYPRPDVTRSISMRREAPGPSISEFHLAKGPSSLLLPSLPGLGLSNSGSMPNASTLIPRRESGTGEEYPFPSRPVAIPPPSDLKLPPISSLALLDEDTWISAIAARRSQ